MTQPGRDDPERLIVAWNFSANALEVFKELRDPMRQAARRGLRFVLSQAPNEGDVDDVVTRAFSEVLKDISDEVKRDPVAFAKVVAHRRGVDRGRVIIREREKIKDLSPRGRAASRHRRGSSSCCCQGAAAPCGRAGHERTNGPAARRDRADGDGPGVAVGLDA